MSRHMVCVVVLCASLSEGGLGRLTPSETFSAMGKRTNSGSAFLDIHLSLKDGSLLLSNLLVKLLRSVDVFWVRLKEVRVKLG